MKRISISRSPLDWLGKDPQHNSERTEDATTATVEPPTAPAPSTIPQAIEVTDTPESLKPLTPPPSEIVAPPVPAEKGSAAPPLVEVPAAPASKKAAAGARSRRPVKPQESLQGLVRTTYHVFEETRLKVEEYAYWERMKIFEVVNKALQEYFERHPLSHK